MTRKDRRGSRQGNDHKWRQKPKERQPVRKSGWIANAGYGRTMKNYRN
jgi:hypothetical protein